MPQRTSSKLPSNDDLSTAIADVVRDWFESGHVDDITVNRVRSRVESLFELPSGYLKDDETWNKKSKAIIHEEFEALQATAEEQEVDDTEVEVQSPVILSKRSKAAENKVPAPRSKTNGRKRKRPEPELIKDQSTEGSLDGGSSASETPLTTEGKDDSDEGGSRASGMDDSSTQNYSEKKTSESRVKREEDVKDEDRSDDDTTNVEGRAAQVNSDELKVPKGVKGKDTKTSLSDSEMSVLIDEEPPPKKGRRKPSSEARSKKTAKSKTAKGQDDSSLDPQEVEIKRLQSQLLKCGIRKLWHKELARFDTPKAKINHLRDLLKGIGMVGRFSMEKARQIKEERELQAEVQAVQDSAKRWGEVSGSDEEDDEVGGRQQNRGMAKGLKDLEFLGDDDGVETD